MSTRSPSSKPVIPEIRFSDHFKLGKGQAELDFVDVPLNGDAQLFVDPYAFSLEPDPWFIECNNLIVDYFSLLIEAIRKGDLSIAEKLLSKACVRFRPDITAGEFYNKYVLDFLEAEHLSANDSLVHTLKNGKKVVFRTQLKEKHPLTKELLFEIAEKHPELLEKYKRDVGKRANPLTDEELELGHRSARTIDHEATVLDGRGWILVLDDTDLKHLLALRSKSDDSGIARFLHERMKSLLM